MSIKQRLEKHLKNERINQWSRDFTESLLAQVNNGARLSKRQLEVFEQTESEYGDAYSRWCAEWTQEKADCLSLINSAFKNSKGYTLWTLRNMETNEDNSINWEKQLIPTEREYNYILNNKYVKKILINNSEPPKYPVGSLVAIRNINSGAVAWDLKTRGVTKHVQTNQPNKKAVVPYLVVANSGLGRECGPAKGSRKYSVLAVGGARAIEVEERQIKKYRQKKS